MGLVLKQKSFQQISSELGINERGKVQTFVDATVGKNLSAYVSFKTGTQEKSIVLANTYGTGKVEINVPYATYQAYSKRIKKRIGKRGTYPFERMKSDKYNSILNETIAYSRRVVK